MSNKKRKPIIPTKRPKQYIPYQDMSDTDIQKACDSIIQSWELFLSINAPELTLNQDYFIHKRNLFEVVRRCDKRRVYYEMFHNLEDMCEYKQVAIQTFWINTLKPFMVIKESSPIYNAPNELFSLFLIIATINGNWIEKNGVNAPFTYPSDQRIADIVYDFKYCSLSRESMIAFVETFADVYGVGIDYIFMRNQRQKNQSTQNKP